MAVTNWSNQSANWTTAADWSAGVPTALLDAYIGFPGTYTVMLGTAAQAHSLTMAAGPGATFSESATGSLAAAGGLTVNSGTAILDGANAFGQTTLEGGTLVVGAANALGFADLEFVTGLLTNNVSVALANNLDIAGQTTIAAVHGTTFTLGGARGWDIDNTLALTMTFGAAGADGTVVWQTGAGAQYVADQPLDVVVAAGVLKAGDADFSELFNAPGGDRLTIAAGATVDLAGFDTTINLVGGAGTVTSATPATLTLTSSTTFAGQITGALSLSADTEWLTGANTYTGSTNLSNLTLGDNGRTGSIAAASRVTIGQKLIVYRSNAYALANFISGPGTLYTIGTGTTKVSHANTFSGGAVVQAGVLEVTNANALGTGYVDLVGPARFLAGVDFVLPSTLLIANTAAATLAAGTGHTLATNATKPWTLELTGGALTFGAKGFTGTVLWNTPAGYSFPNAGSFALNIAYGTLQAGDDSFYFLTDSNINGVVTGTTISAAGTLDAAGHPMAITNLRGSGVIMDSGAATTLNFSRGAFSGQINGALTPYMSGVVSLAGGLGSFTAALTIYSGSTLYLSRTSAHNYVLANNTAVATTLVLAAEAKETGVLHGYATNDTLDLRGVASAAATKSFAFNATATTGGKLTVADGTHTEVVRLAGDYTGASFTLAADGHGGTDVTVAGAAPVVHHFAGAVSGFGATHGPAAAGADAWRRPSAALAAPLAHPA